MRQRATARIGRAMVATQVERTVRGAKLRFLQPKLHIMAMRWPLLEYTMDMVRELPDDGRCGSWTLTGW
jgi:hypothetical protein